MSRAETLDIGGSGPAPQLELPGVPPERAIARAGSGPEAILALMSQAVERGIPVETMKTFQEMYHAEQDRAARLEYAAALARFQRECPPVPPDAELAHLKTVSKEGVERRVRFATIQGIRDHMQPYLESNGFSVSLDASTDGDMLTGVATLQHVNGHFERSKFTLPTASKTPAMSPQQAYEAAYSFACRIALRSVTGVRVASDDAQAEADADPTTISDEQWVTLVDLSDEVKADPQKFLKYLKVASLKDLPASRYDEAVRALEAKRRKP